jgi:hypothetical protein
MGARTRELTTLWSSAFKTNTEARKKLGYFGNTLPNPGLRPSGFRTFGATDVISSFACQSRWQSRRAGWLAHINHEPLGEFEDRIALRRLRPPRIGGDNGRTM